MDPKHLKYILLVALFGYSYYLVYSLTSDHYKSKIENSRIAQELAIANAVNLANADAKLREDSLNQTLATINTNLKKEKENVKTLSSRLERLNSSYGLSVPTKGFASRFGTDNNTSPTPGAGAEERSELTTEAGSALISIARDGDEAIIQLNAVIDAYEKVREVGCGAPVPYKEIQ